MSPSPLLPPDEAISAPEVSATRWDRAGIIASGLCLVHCIVLPLVIVLLPGLGIAWLADEAIHKWLLIVLVVFAVPAFRSGYRVHRQRWIPLLGTLSLALLTVTAYGVPGVLSEDWERPLSVAGSACLIAAHAANIWFSRGWQRSRPAAHAGHHYH